jgi:hypothetical protein
MPRPDPEPITIVEEPRASLVAETPNTRVWDRRKTLRLLLRLRAEMAYFVKTARIIASYLLA